MRDFRNLSVWQRAHAMVLMVYEATRGFPAEERFGLTAQMRRAAVSVASNIVEGAGRGSVLEFGKFLRIAFGSAAELEYQILLSADLGLLTRDESAGLTARLTEIKRMLTGLIRTLTTKDR